MSVGILGSATVAYDETLSKVGGMFQLRGLSEILRPYFGKSRYIVYNISAGGEDVIRNNYAIFSNCEVGNFETAADTFFLTKRDAVTTAAGRKELLGMWFYGKPEKGKVQLYVEPRAADSSVFWVQGYLNHAENTDVRCYFSIDIGGGRHGWGSITFKKGKRHARYFTPTYQDPSSIVDGGEVKILSIIHTWEVPGMYGAFYWGDSVDPMTGEPRKWNDDDFLQYARAYPEKACEALIAMPNRELYINYGKVNEDYGVVEDFFATQVEADAWYEANGYKVSDEQYKNPFAMTTKFIGIKEDGSRVNITGHEVVEEITDGDPEGMFRLIVVDVSPYLFLRYQDNLLGYIVQGEKRVINYTIENERSTPNPIIMFMNSFGVPELCYCHGTKESEPKYERDAAVINGIYRNFRIKETRFFNADSGVLHEGEVEWFLELMRSEEVYECRMTAEGYDRWKEIAITDSKCEYTNEDDNLPRYMLTYRISQKQQNYDMNNIFGNPSDLPDMSNFPLIFTNQFAENFM